MPDAAGFFTYPQNPSFEIADSYPLSMGRNKIPTAIQDAKGAFLHDPQRKRTAEPTTDRPIGDPPSYLTKREVEVWRDLADQALPGVLMESDRLIFGVLVRLAAKFFSRRTMMASETAQLIQLSSKFAMNPADRSKVSVEKPKQSALASFMQQRNKPDQTIQ